MVSESMGANAPPPPPPPPEHGQFGPQGHGWQDLCRGSLNNILCGPHGFRGVFSIYSQWTITPRVWANFDPRGMVGRIYVGDHWTLLYIKYIGCEPELKWHEL